jgi:ATP-binding cassette, subfamily F, member 2
MPPQSASKQKRLAEKAAKQAAKQKASTQDASSSTTTPTGSTNGGSSINTPLTSLSAATSTDELNSMEKLKIATERCAVWFDRNARFLDDRMYRSAAGVLVSDAKGRDIKMDQYTLSFHGRLLIEGAEVSLNYGQRYGLLGENGSGKVYIPPLLQF